MGIEEDRVELTGSKLEKLLYRLREVGGGFVVRASDGTWESTAAVPPTGSGAYYEGLPGGEIRLWSGRGDGYYQRI